MELQLQSRHVSWRTPDWSAAAVAGLAAGAVLMVLDLCWPLVFGNGDPWATSHKIAALLLGQQALHSSGLDLGVVAAALLIHYTLGVFSGLVIGIAIAGLRCEGSLAMTQVIGYVFGVVVYFVNFYVLAALFPWFQEMRGEATFLGQLAFGVCAAEVYRRLNRRPVAA
ncbi:hypothetical protein [Roseateles saccharophilus]|uniref:Uncharacterized protein n=1 Tax=Roseateles saccharophilus TaxID=304 RepID=A0A4V2VQC5_ROSSA|nr:hypothetical protein [Roseateles saccharophilus]MDG0833379.1 hypothetical protein [Roseateles saccharophilus]TCU93829.1 hypothetical protein EV671_101889 [Roseateles saccharophilus]